MKKYRYVSCGMFSGTDGKRYDIEIPSFVTSDTEEEAKIDTHTYRFKKINGEPKILCFENEEITGSGTDSEGRKYITTKVEGETSFSYSYDEFIKAGGTMRQLKEEARDKCVIDGNEDFIPTKKTFAEIFPSMEDDKLYYIDNEAYYISEED